MVFGFRNKMNKKIHQPTIIQTNTQSNIPKSTHTIIKNKLTIQCQIRDSETEQKDEIIRKIQRTFNNENHHSFIIGPVIDRISNNFKKRNEM